MRVRVFGLLASCVVLGVGAIGFALSRVPDAPSLSPLQDGLESVGALLGPLFGAPRGGETLARLLKDAFVPILALGAGMFLLSVWRLRARRSGREPDGEPVERGRPARERRVLRRIEKQALTLAKKGRGLEAAELCFASGLLDRSARLFVEAGAFVRAAEIRHDQNRFREAAELYLQAGDPESAGSIFAAHDAPSRAAECFLAAGRKSVAAEMFEKAGAFRQAGDCYAEAGFHRNAAQAFVRCQAWREAAQALEEVILEEGSRTKTGQDPRRQRELGQLVAQTGRLYEQAGDLERASAVLEKGGCYALAGEIALRRESYAEASELFLKAHEPLRAAEALQRLGEEQPAFRILGEYYRDRGEDKQAAEALEKAEEFLAAGDLYRKLEDPSKAGDCYARHGDSIQAAEMYRVAGDPERAAIHYERAGRFQEAADCFAELGDASRQAAALVSAGLLLRAGRLYREQGLDDDAIKVLQQIAASQPDFQPASAILGEIFRERRMLSLAVKKLRQAVGQSEIGRENVRVFYTLATVHEANGDLREAVELYEKILAFDYHYEDVETRLARTRELLKELPPADSLASGNSSNGALAQPASSGRYQILGELGRGGMGIVYKAKDSVLDRVVAYKVLPESFKENPQALRNFLREAKSAAQLNHPNIVTVYDAGEQGSSYYIAMEYVDGTTLKEIVRRKGAISASGVFHVLVQMCEALAYAHDKKIVHRDVKTANTMWTRDRKAKIMDFGLAKVVEEVRNHTTLVSGTPYYMSPEQTLGRNVDHRTDIYSLGVTLFELATGTLPFREGNVPYHHVHTPAPDPREFKPDLPPALAEIICRCLRKDPAERYDSIRAISARAREVLGGGSSTS